MPRNIGTTTWNNLNIGTLGKAEAYNSKFDDFDAPNEDKLVNNSTVSDDDNEDDVDEDLLAAVMQPMLRMTKLQTDD